ncbi:hypothetical protein BN381_80421 [Candidatus Microthrix parvicella RN1]|uniref:Uncharacterized protein n=1 Tax=Candidatus Neomicrothrix parvicella RN1 TaxID=1229780 RepID=R4Z747_9ACTN|nr:hypothetical protein BN381_80421 [Candidatus Microthrix parvicella RN1]
MTFDPDDKALRSRELVEESHWRYAVLFSVLIRPVLNAYSFAI